MTASSLSRNEAQVAADHIMSMIARGACVTAEEKAMAHYIVSETELNAAPQGASANHNPATPGQRTPAAPAPHDDKSKSPIGDRSFDEWWKDAGYAQYFGVDAKTVAFDAWNACATAAEAWRDAWRNT